MRHIATIAAIAIAFGALNAIAQAPEKPPGIGDQVYSIGDNRNSASSSSRVSPSTQDRIVRGRFVAIGGAMKTEPAPCVSCHGLDGAGDTSGAFPKLSGQSAWYLYKSMHDFASGARENTIMTPIARMMSDSDMQSVASFYAALEPQALASARERDTRLLQIGGALSAVGAPDRGVPACASCHGANGEGGQLIYPALAGQYADYTAAQLQAWKRGERQGDPLNVMRNIAVEMSDEQIRAVALYFETLEPTRSSGLRASRPARRPASPVATPVRGNAAPAQPGAKPPYLQQPGSPGAKSSD